MYHSARSAAHNTFTGPVSDRRCPPHHLAPLLASSSSRYSTALHCGRTADEPSARVSHQKMSQRQSQEGVKRWSGGGPLTLRENQGPARRSHPIPLLTFSADRSATVALRSPLLAPGVCVFVVPKGSVGGGGGMKPNLPSFYLPPFLYLSLFRFSPSAHYLSSLLISPSSSSPPPLYLYHTFHFPPSHLHQSSHPPLSFTTPSGTHNHLGTGIARVLPNPGPPTPPPSSHPNNEISPARRPLGCLPPRVSHRGAGSCRGRSRKEP